MIFKADDISVRIIQESIDNVNIYSKEYNLDPENQASSIYGLNCNDSSNCIILAGGGASGVSEQSAIVQDSKLWIGIGDQLVCLSLPNFEMLWHLQVDWATCFGLYLSPDGLGLLIHGELTISKVTFSGEVLWSIGGKDIFTEGFEIHKDYIEAIDFNHEKYHIEIDNGNSELL